MGRREENKARKRSRLEEEGLSLFLEHGYDRCSIEQIAAASEVARGTFYLYFPDKLTLFETLIDRFYEPLLGIMSGVHDELSSATERREAVAIYERMGGKVAMLGLTNAGALMLAFREIRRVGEAGDKLREREGRLVEAITGLTGQAADRGLITAPDPRLYTLIIYGSVERLIWEFLQGHDLGDDPEALATEVVRVFGRTLELPE